MDPFENHSFKLLRKILSFLGLWYTQPYRERLLRHFIIGFLLIYVLLIQLCQISTMGHDLMSIISVLQVFIPSICFATTYYVYILHFVRVQKIFSYIKQDWEQLYDDVGLKTMQKCAYESKLFTYIIGFLYAFFACWISLQSILNKIFISNERVGAIDRFALTTCIDHYIDREIYYYYVTAIQIMLIILEILVATGCYSAYFLTIQHVCALLSITKGRIDQTFQNMHRNDDVILIPIDLSQWLISINKNLVRIKEIIYVLNKISEKCQLLQIMLSFFIFIIDFAWILQIPSMRKNNKNLEDIPVVIMSIAGTLLPVYFNCYIGQKLIDYSVIVYRETCLVPIHDISLKSQKLLMTMLLINAKPCTISIGKIFVSSHDFFSDLLRTSLSFAIVLHSKQQTWV